MSFTTFKKNQEAKNEIKYKSKYVYDNIFF